MNYKQEVEELRKDFAEQERRLLTVLEQIAEQERRLLTVLEQIAELELEASYLHDRLAAGRYVLSNEALLKAAVKAAKAAR